MCCLECERGRSPWKTLPFLGRVVLVVVGLVFASEGRNDGGNGVLLPSVDGSGAGHALPATNNHFSRSHVRGDADPLWPAATHASLVARIRTGQSLSAKLHLSG